MGKFINSVTYAFLFIILCSCYSPNLIVEDDIYLIKSTEIPIGESLNDQTSYANFKSRTEGSALYSSFFDDECSITWRQASRDSRFLIIGYGNPYFRSPCSGNGYWGLPYFSPYMFGYYNPLYMYDPFGSPYGFNATALSPGYWGGTYGYTNVNSTFFYYSGSNFPQNHYSGLLSVGSGCSDPNRSSGKLINQVQHTPDPLHAEITRRQISLENNQIIGQNETSTTNQNHLRTFPESELRPVNNRGISSPGLNTRSENIPNKKPVVSRQPPRNNNYQLRQSTSPGNNRIIGSGNGVSGSRNTPIPVRRH